MTQVVWERGSARDADAASVGQSEDHEQEEEEDGEGIEERSQSQETGVDGTEEDGFRMADDSSSSHGFAIVNAAILSSLIHFANKKQKLTHSDVATFAVATAPYPPSEQEIIACVELQNLHKQLQGKKRARTTTPTPAHDANSSTALPAAPTNRDAISVGMERYGAESTIGATPPTPLVIPAASDGSVFAFATALGSSSSSMASASARDCTQGEEKQQQVPPSEPASPATAATLLEDNDSSRMDIDVSTAQPVSSATAAAELSSPVPSPSTMMHSDPAAIPPAAAEASSLCVSSTSSSVTMHSDQAAILPSLAPTSLVNATSPISASALAPAALGSSSVSMSSAGAQVERAQSEEQQQQAPPSEPASPVASATLEGDTFEGPSPMTTAQHAAAAAAAGASSLCVNSASSSSTTTHSDQAAIPPALAFTSVSSSGESGDSSWWRVMMRFLWE